MGPSSPRAMEVSSIKNMTRLDLARPGILDDLRSAWVDSWPRFVDSQRNMEVLGQLLMSPAIVWFEGPTAKSFLFLESIFPGDSATIHMVSADGWTKEAKLKLQKQIAAIIGMYRLRRLSLTMPLPVSSVAKLAESCGFIQEGVLRQACMFDSKPTDVAIYGLLAKVPKKSRHRRAKKARPPFNPPKVVEAQGAPPA